MINLVDKQIQEAIEALKDDIKNADLYDLYSEDETICSIDDVATVLNLNQKQEIELIETKEANRQLSIELKKKDQIINSMAEFLEALKLCTIAGDDLMYKEDWIEYFKNKLHSSEQKRTVERTSRKWKN
jgi:hypothetical protein